MSDRPPDLPCPACGALSQPILWGLIEWDDAMSGKFDGWAIGGCCVELPARTHRCSNGHDWRDERYARPDSS